MADNIAVKDGTGASKTLRALDVGSGILVMVHALVDATGADLPLMGRGIANASANFTRPANTTAYTAADLVANNTTAGSVTPLSFTVARYALGGGRITRAFLTKSTVTTTAATFRLHLFTASPTVTNGDNGAFATNGLSFGVLGSLDIASMRAYGDGAFGEVFASSPGIAFKLTSGSVLYGLTEALGAYTPGNAEVFTWKLDVEQL